MRWIAVTAAERPEVDADVLLWCDWGGATIGHLESDGQLIDDEYHPVPATRWMTIEPPDESPGGVYSTEETG